MSDTGGDAPVPFELLGGEPGVRALVDRFYDLMDLEPQFAGLRALHPGALDGSRDKLSWFLCGWLGGPDHYVERFGHPRLRARHLPYPIGIAERDQWLACMGLALQDLAVDETLATRLLQAFFGTADWMRNRGG
jgi:hemoglobin